MRVMSSGPNQLRRSGTATAMRAIPSTCIAESFLEGLVFSQPKDDKAQLAIEATLIAALRNPFQRGRDGPGGWWFVQEGRVKIADSDFSPDLAGWLVGRVPGRPLAGDKVAIVPDWICEVHSAATRGYDFLVKRAFYAGLGVRVLWFIDPDARTLFVSKLSRGRWCDVGVYGDNDEVRVEPFEEHSVKCAEWWRAAKD